METTESNTSDTLTQDDIKETLQYLYGLTASGIKPGLDRTEKLLSLLGDPHLAYPSILVAGTNGKGTTATFLDSAFREAKMKTALYTSPHLMNFNERIKTGDFVGQSEITDEDIVRLARRMRVLIDENFEDENDRPTFFEFTTALAFEYFREKGVEMAVVEVGMGGRLDATNVLNPLVSVITSIAVDHTDYLGESLYDIAKEKAGIIKQGGQVVACIEDGNDDARRAIEEVAEEKGAELYFEGRDFYVKPNNFLFDFYSTGKPMWALSVNMKGAHQLKNAACALMTLEALLKKGVEVERPVRRRGVAKSWLPGRFEIIGMSPAVVLDCAHNEQGATALTNVLREYGMGRLFLVLGVMEDKDVVGIVRGLYPLTHTVILTRADNERSAPTDLLAEKLKTFEGIDELEVMEVEQVGDAINKAFELAKPEDTVCITGSVCLVGQARGFLFEREEEEEAID